MRNPKRDLTPGLSESGSEEEADLDQLQVSNEISGQEMDASAEVTISSSQTTSSASDTDFLTMVLEAYRNSPIANPEKGLSTRRIRTYIKENFRVHKSEMKEKLKPVLEDAVERNILIQTGKVLMTGSVRLNPAYANKKSTVSQSQQQQQDEPAMPKRQSNFHWVGDRKRKADNDASRGDAKRRLAFQKIA
ncbi:uncharacterized protein LOC129779728 [Toxorhynchites rutilus septentrionalis]|uniref:uncharacterized protein LOC129779728 n=1 Tax=Toxorhynchites rutilus septentrionalis TaxID=329112 RepID=UPI002478DB25|nr:uncharacterized protein LOC129779728 [Toxorhynchites rutilus septentrionalis]